MTVRSSQPSWKAIPTDSPRRIAGTRRRCTASAGRCSGNPPTRPMPCRTHSSSPQPGCPGCGTRSGCVPGCMRLRATNATGGCAAVTGRRPLRLRRTWPMKPQTSPRPRRRRSCVPWCVTPSPGWDPPNVKSSNCSSVRVLTAVRWRGYSGSPAATRTRCYPVPAASLRPRSGCLSVARTGRKDCPVLDMLLKEWDDRLTVLVRKRVNRHVERCQVCSGRQGREMTPAMLLGAMPIAGLPLARSPQGSGARFCGPPSEIRPQRRRMGLLREPCTRSGIAGSPGPSIRQERAGRGRGQRMPARWRASRPRLRSASR